MRWGFLLHLSNHKLENKSSKCKEDVIDYTISWAVSVLNELEIHLRKEFLLETQCTVNRLLSSKKAQPGAALLQTHTLF